jgi:molybdate transport system substrate-binding protein
MGCRTAWLGLAFSIGLAVVAAERAAAAGPLRLLAAGSLKAPLTELARAFEARTGRPVALAFGASGLLRGRIEQGEPTDLFASANLEHPRALAAAGRGGPAVPFARNKLCALSQPGLGLTPANLLDKLLDSALRLGISTPEADPSGDYARALFRKAETIRPGSFARLEAKALKLTGAADSALAPEGRSTYAWLMTARRADIFLIYCTNAALARQEAPQLEITEPPPALAVGADYGLIVLSHDPDAGRLARFILADEGQRILAGCGFGPPSP